MDDAPDALPVNPDQPILAEAPLLALCDPPLTPRRYTGGGWTIAAMCAGIAILACCIIIPQAEANRRLAYERLKLQDDLNQIQKQSAVNQDFLDKLATDPTLAQRLAQRQMKVVRRGTQVLPLPGMDNWNNTSPFSLVKVPAPPPLPAYTPVPGRLSQLCNDPHSRIYLLGAGMLLVAAGLVLGYSPRRA
jgi:hypothetical protein